MKFFTALPWLFLVIVGCSADPEEAEEVSEFEEIITIYAAEEEEEGELRSDQVYDYTQILSVNIGLYEEPGVMVLDHYVAQGEAAHIDGYYWYNKHQKMLQLEGFCDDEGWFYLTESYKGENTGYMEFTLEGNSEDAFWSISDASKERENFKATVLETRVNDDVYVEDHYYTFEHTITIYDGEGDVEEEALNELHVSFINEKYLAFKIFVIGRNAHLGDVGGVAIIEGDKAYYDNQGKEEWDVCLLTFDLDSDQITVHEEDCSGYHGMNVYFDCTFERVE